MDEKFQLITRNLAEVVGVEDLQELLAEDRNPVIYWGTAPTGRIHIGYLVPLLKIADFLKAGCKVKILIADLHAFLDSSKSSLQVVDKRAIYYSRMIKKILECLNVDTNKLEFVRGSDYQLSPKYTLDMYKFHSLITVSAAKNAGAEVVKQAENPLMTGLLYPGLQALDEEYLQADAQFGGVDQRKIFMYAHNFLPKLGYRKRIHLMNEMVTGLRFVKKNDEQVEKMSASNVNSKVDFLDTPKEIKTKINRAYCLEGDVEDNCLLEILDKILFKVLAHCGTSFRINRKERFGGPITYENFEQVYQDFATGILHPGDLKLGISDLLCEIIAPIRVHFAVDDLQLIKEAYA